MSSENDMGECMDHKKRRYTLLSVLLVSYAITTAVLLFMYFAFGITPLYFYLFPSWMILWWILFDDDADYDCECDCSCDCSQF